MLTIHGSSSAADVKKYFDVADYYSEGQETIGRWGGRLAAKLGLSGTVDKVSFERLCDNLHPATGEQLTLRTNDNRRVGYDFTFSAPKSFSIAEALASGDERERLLAAFGASVDETMAEIQEDMHTRVRKGGTFNDRRTGSIVWASFDHSTAMPVDGGPPDMQRHRHVFAFNVTEDGVEECLKAGEFSYAKRDGEYFTAAFYSRLASKLEAMGYVIDRKGGKEWEIAGVPDSAIGTFSKRSEQVEEEHRNRMNPDHPDFDADYREHYKHELGAKTRGGKQKELTQEELRKAWHGQLSDAERRALLAVYGKELAAGPEVTAAAAVEYAIAHCSEQNSVVPERELKRVALLFGLGSLTPEQVAAELPRHGVIVRDIDGRRMATTEALQAEERFIVGMAANGRGSVAPVGVAEGLTRTLDDGKRLNDGQWETVQGLLESSNAVNVVEGPAGAGKSWMLKKFDEGMRLGGEAVTYLATTTDAADVLAKDGFEVNTVARFLLDEKLQNAAKGGLVVVDESSMLGHKDAHRLFEVAKRLHLKLIFVGDPYQHGSVQRGALMRVLTDYGGIRPFRLSELMRQEDPAYRAAAKLLSEGRTVEGFDALDGLGWVKDMANATDRYRHIAADYLQAVDDGKSVLVVSPTHAEAAHITREIRDQLRAAGRLGEKDTAFTRLVAVNASEAERGQATTYRPGDVIQFFQNAKGHKKGARLVVGDPAAVPLADASKFQLYRAETVPLAKGDRIRFTSTVKTLDGKHKLINGSTRTVDTITPGGNLRLDNGWVVAGDVGHFRPGFVETSFGSQGRTVQRVILGMASSSLPATNQEQMYVSASRAKERVTLYTDDKDAVRDAVQRSSQKLAALDLEKKPVAVCDRARRQAVRKRRFALVERVRAAWAAITRQPQPERQAGYGR